MKLNKLSIPFRKAPLPAIMTIISLMLFIGAYWFVAENTIKPYYFAVFLFGLPVAVFGTITFFTASEKIKEPASAVTTVVFIFSLVFAVLIAFAFIIIDSATSGTTDVNYYEKVLQLAGYPNNPLTRCFPDKIPGNAQDIEFSYYPALGQGGKVFALKFGSDEDSIMAYLEEYSNWAKWTGKSSGSEAEKHGIFPGSLDVYTDSPEDFTIYLIDSRPYRPEDWNHGERSLVAVSENGNEILFLAQTW